MKPPRIVMELECEECDENGLVIEDCMWGVKCPMCGGTRVCRAAVSLEDFAQLFGVQLTMLPGVTGHLIPNPSADWKPSR